MNTRNKDSPVVYICSRFRGNIAHNMAMARRYSRFAADRGCVPLTPHLWLPQFLSEETERDLAISMDLKLLERCDELWVCGDEISEGMAPRDALVNSSKSRLRPVMMASLTTILGMAPLISDPMYGSMAVCIMSGLAMGTLIILVFLPILYSTIFKVKKTNKA